MKYPLKYIYFSLVCMTEPCPSNFVLHIKMKDIEAQDMASFSNLSIYLSNTVLWNTCLNGQFKVYMHRRENI